MASDDRTVSSNTMDIIYNELNKFKTEVQRKVNKKFEKKELELEKKELELEKKVLELEKELKYQEALARASKELLNRNWSLEKIADLMKMDKNDVESLLNRFNLK